MKNTIRLELKDCVNIENVIKLHTENIATRRNILKFSTALSFLLFYSFSANAVNVTSWADINTNKTAESILFSNDITVSGTKKIESTTDNQVVDGGGYSLVGASGYQLQLKGSNVTIQNMGTVIDGTSDDNTFSYIDADGNTVYKKITASVSGFSNTVPINITKSFTFRNNVYSNNTTKTLLNISSSATAENPARIENSIFYNNGNKNAGSWSSLINVSGNLEINNVIFDSNKAEGSIIEVHSALNINNSIFQNNDMTYMSVISIEGGQLEISNSQFINNANYEGGAITNTGIGFKSVSNTIFENNISRYSGGGAIWLPIQDYEPIKNHYFSEVTFTANEAADYGGAIYISGAGTASHYGYFLDSMFKGNVASLGGGILTSNLVNLWVVDTNFEDNTAYAGGGIYAADLTLNIYAKSNDVTFSGNVANDQDDSFNGGEAVFMEADEAYAEMDVNAAAEKKVVFDNTVAGYGEGVVLNINKSGLTYVDFDGEEVEVAADGEIQFNARVGDGDNYFSAINLWGGKLSIGQNDELNEGVDNPDGYLNDNNFYVTGDSTLNTVNGVIGEFSPQEFEIDAALDYEFDIDLANTASDKINGATVNEGGSVNLSVLNVISDTDANSVKVTYSDTNIGGILKDDYQITTSTATYNVTAQNDSDGSYLIFGKSSEIGGLAKAIKDASNVYSNTSGEDEVVEAWDGNSLQADLVINGNNNSIKTENGLDGIDVGAEYTLTMNDVTDMTGFNYALSNEGTVELNNTTISDEVINNGVLEVNESVSLGTVSGSGTTNINADHELTGTVSGNTVNVKNAKLSGIDNLASDVVLNAIGSTIALDNKTATVKSANFDAKSVLELSVNSVSDYGSLTADTITVAEGATLKATLAQGIVSAGKPATLQLLSANNKDFNNFTDSFDNNMYHFEKVDKNGSYKISQTKSAEEVVEEDGGQEWVAQAAADYVDVGQFKGGTVAEDIANALAALAQNDADALIAEIKALAPTETAVVQDQAIDDVNRLFKTVDDYLRGNRSLIGLSSGDKDAGVSIWANPYIGTSKLDSRGKIAGMSTDSHGITAGIEKKVNPTLKFGVGMQYDVTDIDMKRRDIDSTSTVGFVYGEYKPSRWFVNATASYGVTDYDEEKYALGISYKANYAVHVASATAVTGYQFKYLTPEVGVRYYDIKREGYTDSAMQNVQKVNTDILRAFGGVRFVKDCGIFSPNIYFGMTYDIRSAKPNTVVNLANDTSYTVIGKRLSRWGYELDVGVNARVTDDLSIGADYMGTYREKYQEHTGMIKLKYNF